MQLTDRTVKAMKPGPKRIRRSDGGGLFIEVKPNGAKYWRLAYRYFGQQRTLALGAYPSVSLAEAREARDDAKEVLARGLDPANGTAPEKATWADVADEYLARRIKQGISPSTEKKLRILINKTRPDLGRRTVSSLKPLDLLPILREQEANGHFETAIRLRSVMGRIFRFAVSTGRAEADVSRDLRDALLPPATRHHAALTDQKEVGGLMRAIRGYENLTTRTALLVLAYTFVRPGEVRQARWSEFDGDTWTIPAERMKSRRKHIVPLARQVVEALDRLRPMTGQYGWVFPQLRQPSRSLSNQTMNAALRRMGFTSDVHVPHGFRTTASTNLNEQGWNPDWIERQLAHVPGNKVRAAYNAAQYLEGRREMMQAWADWLDAAEAQ